jgi:hypothetical protein
MWALVVESALKRLAKLDRKVKIQMKYRSLKLALYAVIVPHN